MWFSTRWHVNPSPRAAGLVAGLLACTLCLPGLANTEPPADGPPTNANAGQRSVAASLDAATPQLPGRRLQGEATLRFFGLRIYHARLWTLPDFRANALAQQPFVLELEYLRNLQGSAIAERSLQEMRRGGSFSESQAQRWLGEMERLFPDVRAGDRLAGHHQPGQGVSFWHNGRLVGQLQDADFARLFFGIWLAPTTSEPAARQALLGIHETSRR